MLLIKKTILSFPAPGATTEEPTTEVTTTEEPTTEEPTTEVTTTEEPTTEEPTTEVTTTEVTTTEEPTTTQSGPCETNWAYLADTDRCYRHYIATLNYDSAVSACSSEGALLAWSNSQAEYDFLAALTG